ncbi:MAG: ABC transporter permease, partial [Rudaea sp.]
IVLMTGYLLAPFFLIIPLMFSTIVGAESFVGEKERKTLEALLYTPATDAELFFAKVAASVVPAVGLGWFTFLVYTVVVNAAGYPQMGRIWFPLVNWWPLMLWVTPAIATLGMAVIVIISARVGTFMEAYQVSGSLVVVVLALIVGQVTGLLYLSLWTSIIVGVVVWVLDAALILFGIRNFQRSALLSRL